LPIFLWLYENDCGTYNLVSKDENRGILVQYQKNDCLDGGRSSYKKAGLVLGSQNDWAQKKREEDVLPIQRKTDGSRI
jgi:hypothetical protein